MLKKLTPNLMVEDVRKTMAFYHDVLGFETVTTVEGNNEPTSPSCSVRA